MWAVGSGGRMRRKEGGCRQTKIMHEAWSRAGFTMRLKGFDLLVEYVADPA